MCRYDSDVAVIIIAAVQVHRYSDCDSALSIPVCDAVRLFPSSLAVTARRHPCANEQIMLICEVNGTRLDVRLDSRYRARYLDTNRVDDVRTVSGSNIKLRTILTGNEAIAHSLRRLTATIIVEVTESSRGLHNIDCSSDTDSDSQVFTFQIAGRSVSEYWLHV